MNEKLLDIELAFSSLQHLTITRVVNYLTYIFKSGDDEIVLGALTTTPKAAIKYFVDGALLAERTSIIFWGGPPGEHNWFKGTFLSLLIDRLFYNVVTGNDDIIDRFLESINGR